MKMNQANEDLVSKAKERLNEIITIGKTRNGISPSIDSNVRPKWFDKKLFEHAQDLHLRYGVIMQICHIIGLNFGFFISSVMTTLLATGHSRTISKLFDRYLGTSLHVSNWFDGDPFDPKSKCHRSLKIVNGMHKKTFGKMNKGFGLEEDGKNQLYLNQQEMAEGQFAVVGLMAIFPKELGFHNWTDDDFHALFHFWRVIGYCLGIDDQFNICSGTDDEVRELCRQMYFNCLLPAIKESTDPIGFQMGNAVCNAMSPINLRISYNPLFNCASSFLELDPKNFPLVTLNDTIGYYRYKLLWNHLSKYEWIMKLLTKSMKYKLTQASIDRKEHETFLDEKYPEVKFESRCPFSFKSEN